ncbi:MAG TPA: AraC family transcriptional regulator [Gemmatimonadaceae bacterium]
MSLSTRLAAATIGDLEPPDSRHQIILTSGATIVLYVVPRSGRVFVVDPVTALCVNPGEVVRLHEARREGYRATVISVDPELVAGGTLTGAQSPTCHARLPVRAVVLSATALLLAQRLRRERRWDAARTGPAVRLSGATDRSESALAFVRALFSGVEDPFTTAGEGRAHPHRWRVLADAVKQEIGEEPAAPHLIKDVAARLDMSPFHLARVFRAETGLSIHQYLLRLRMAGALERLCRDSVSISRLALDLGFSSHSHFTAAFQRLFGASPGSVRSSLCAEDCACADAGRGQLRHG